MCAARERPPETGHVCVGADSHSTTGGAFGAFMIGIGATEMTGVLATGEIWVRVPETLRVSVSGTLSDGVAAKDVILKLCGDIGVMGEHAFIAQVGTSVGSVACGGSTQWLPITVGDRTARGILFLNQRYAAFTSLSMGLVNSVVPTVKGPDGEFITKFSGDRTCLADWNTDPLGYALRESGYRWRHQEGPQG